MLKAIFRTHDNFTRLFVGLKPIPDLHPENKSKRNILSEVINMKKHIFQKPDTLILILILAVATFLRFYRIREIPFTHDEFSALFRTGYDHFRELINQGVKIDGHPAGVQVFLNYWVKLTGMTEWLVKLPFLFAGVLSTYLIYNIGCRWFNKTVGLIAAAFLATLQYPVMYSQIARPYGSGLFLTLAMVLFWTNLMLTPEKNFRKNAILFVVTASLCTYNHHFSLLFAFIVGITGIFLIPSAYRKRYLGLGLAIILLYLPHTGIFLYQLGMGGVEGWLAKPGYDFPIKYLGYIFHFSFYSTFLAAALFLFGIFQSGRNQIKKGFFLISLLWFLIPLVIGFTYSMLVSSVLQYSVLLFSFPYLFFVLFGHIREQKPFVNQVLVVSILTVNILTLTLERDHYRIFYNSPYERIVVDFKSIAEKPYLKIIVSHPKITQYYINKHQVSQSFHWEKSVESEEELIGFLKAHSSKYDTLFLGSLSSVHPVAIPVIMDYYPEMVSENNYMGGSSYIFARSNKNSKTFVDQLDFSPSFPTFWSGIDPNGITRDTTEKENYLYRMNEQMEWGPTYTRNIRELIDSQNDYIDISVDFTPGDSLSQVILVASLEENGQSIFWNGSDASKYSNNLLQDSCSIRAHISVKLSDIKLSGNDVMLKAFIWNKGKRTFMADNFTISLRKGNPILYGHIEKIPYSRD